MMKTALLKIALLCQFLGAKKVLAFDLLIHTQARIDSACETKQDQRQEAADAKDTYRWKEGS